MSNTETIVLGPSHELPAQSDLNGADWNFVLIHRDDRIIMQTWGNFCSKIVTKIVEHDADEKPMYWYHKKLYKFCYDQYDKYGDYYRVLDNSYGEPGNDDIYEVR